MSAEQIDEALAGEDPTTVLFVAAWSPASILCREKAGAHVITVDVDEHPQTADRWEVWSVPTLLTIEEGTVRRRVLGSRIADILS